MFFFVCFGYAFLYFLRPFIGLYIFAFARSPCVFISLKAENYFNERYHRLCKEAFLNLEFCPQILLCAFIRRIVWSDGCFNDWSFNIWTCTFDFGF